jgi:hypothetical protein
VFVATADDLEQQVRVTSVIGQVADLVDAKQRRPTLVAEAALEGACRVLRGQIEQELGGGDEEDRVPARTA